MPKYVSPKNLVPRVWGNTFRAILILNALEKGNKPDVDIVRSCTTYFRELHRLFNEEYLDPRSFDIRRFNDPEFYPTPQLSPAVHETTKAHLKSLLAFLDELGAGKSDVDVDTAFGDVKAIIDYFYY